MRRTGDNRYQSYCGTKTSIMVGTPNKIAIDHPFQTASIPSTTRTDGDKLNSAFGKIRTPPSKKPPAGVSELEFD
jgi:hypothetical protein